MIHASSVVAFLISVLIAVGSTDETTRVSSILSINSRLCVINVILFVRLLLVDKPCRV